MTWKVVPAQGESPQGGVAKGPGQARDAQREGLCSPLSWASQKILWGKTEEVRGTPREIEVVPWKTKLSEGKTTFTFGDYTQGAQVVPS